MRASAGTGGRSRMLCAASVAGNARNVCRVVSITVSGYRLAKVPAPPAIGYHGAKRKESPLGKQINRIACIFAGLDALLSMTGCGRSRAKPGEDDRVKLKSSDSSISFGAGPDLSKMPSWMPVYPGIKAEGIYSSSSAEATQNTFSFVTVDAPGKIAAFYEDQLKAGGFAVTLRTSGDAGGLISAATANKKRSVVVTLAPAQGTTHVSVLAVEKKNQ